MTDEQEILEVEEGRPMMPEPDEVHEAEVFLMTDEEKPPPGPDEVPQADLEKAAAPALFSRKLKTSEFPIGDTMFTVQAIPATVNKVIMGTNTEVDPRGIQLMNNDGIVIDLFRYGVTDIVGGRDENGAPVVFESENVRIAGKVRPRVKETLIEMMPYELIVRIAAEVKRLSELTPRDRERLGFSTGTSDSEQSAAE